MKSHIVKFYKVPDEYWFRIHFVRPRFKSNIENVLLYMANECCRIPKCSCREYSRRYLNAIRMFPGNIDMKKKTLDNWRTEIPALFGFYKENKEAVKSQIISILIGSIGTLVLGFIGWLFTQFMTKGGI